jgi:hypothetical protein
MRRLDAMCNPPSASMFAWGKGLTTLLVEWLRALQLIQNQLWEQTVAGRHGSAAMRSTPCRHVARSDQPELDLTHGPSRWSNSWLGNTEESEHRHGMAGATWSVLDNTPIRTNLFQKPSSQPCSSIHELSMPSPKLHFFGSHTNRSVTDC